MDALMAFAPAFFNQLLQLQQQQQQTLLAHPPEAPPTSPPQAPPTSPPQAPPINRPDVIKRKGARLEGILAAKRQRLSEREHDSASSVTSEDTVAYSPTWKKSTVAEMWSGIKAEEEEEKKEAAHKEVTDAKRPNPDEAAAATAHPRPGSSITPEPADQQQLGGLAATSPPELEEHVSREAQVVLSNAHAKAMILAKAVGVNAEGHDDLYGVVDAICSSLEFTYTTTLMNTNAPPLNGQAMREELARALLEQMTGVKFDKSPQAVEQKKPKTQEPFGGPRRLCKSPSPKAASEAEERVAALIKRFEQEASALTCASSADSMSDSDKKRLDAIKVVVAVLHAMAARPVRSRMSPPDTWYFLFCALMQPSLMHVICWTGAGYRFRVRRLHILSLAWRLLSESGKERKKRSTRDEIKLAEESLCRSIRNNYKNNGGRYRIDPHGQGEYDFVPQKLHDDVSDSPAEMLSFISEHSIAAAENQPVTPISVQITARPPSLHITARPPTPTPTPAKPFIPPVPLMIPPGIRLAEALDKVIALSNLMMMTAAMVPK